MNVTNNDVLSVLCYVFILHTSNKIVYFLRRKKKKRAKVLSLLSSSRTTGDTDL